MTLDDAKALLARLQRGQVSPEVVLHAFQATPVSDLGFASVDLHRSLRKGFPEVIYGAGKSPDQVARIASRIYQADGRFLVTRIEQKHASAIRRRIRGAQYHQAARCVTFERNPVPKRPGTIVVVAAGTSDLPVAEEAVVTAEIMGNRVERIYDVGVAGLHRLFARLDAIQSANVVIAVAGMEGALPSVVAGLVAKPVIAVPTSVGYGVNLAGLTALFGMLSSCSSGLTVVNIDNGFGAGYAASQINSLAAGGELSSTKSRTPRRTPNSRNKGTLPKASRNGKSRKGSGRSRARAR